MDTVTALLTNDYDGCIVLTASAEYESSMDMDDLAGLLGWDVTDTEAKK